MSKPLIDSRNNYVYCTNCKHWNKLLKHIEDNTVGKIAPSPCCVCYPYNSEDSVKKLVRNKYEEKKYI